MKQLITDNLATWTTAPKGIKKLRELILELAVRGLLVPQDVNDEPASELLTKIAAEKARLVSEGKIKPPKPLAKISEEEKPFDLPMGWEWVNLPDISNYKVGKTPPTKSSIYWSDSDTDIPWVSIADMEHFGRISNTKKKITQEAVKDIFKYEAIPAGSLLMSFKLTVGKVSILETDAFHNEAIISIQPYTGISKDYLFNVLPCRALDGNTKKAIKGNTLNSDSLAALLIPLPPLAEQQRIVAKVDELMQLCDRLEEKQSGSEAMHRQLVSCLLTTLTEASDAQAFQSAWSRIAANFDSLFTTEHSIEQLKQTILQLAVMGKLVPQNPNDEPASELLNKIATEQEKLIAENRLKTKANPHINAKEEFLGKPLNWEYCRLGNLAKFIDYRGQTPEKVESGIPLITAKNVRYGFISRTPYEYIRESDYDQWMTRGFPKINDILFTTEAPLGNVAIVNIEEKFALAQRVICLQLHKPEIARFLRILIMSVQFQKQLLEKATGMTATGIKASKLKELPIPLPPLQEQHRIVTKVDELLTLCEQLKTKLATARTLQQQLAETLVQQAVA